MIYTVTFNPSLDYVVRVTDFQLGNLHRTEKEELYAGGKGINVSIVLKQLGVDSTALGFTAGFVGAEIKNRLSKQGIITDFITVKQGCSRINVKLKSGNHTETEINGQGPLIGLGELEKLHPRLNQLQKGDFLLLSGSVPGRLPDKDGCYAHICEYLNKKKVNFVVDAEGALLKNTLRYQPFLIKPNQQELGMLFGQKLETEESIIYYAMRLQEEGAQNILVSMAGQGALLLDVNGRVIRQNAPKGQVLNSVGAGDSLVAGFLAGLFKSKADRDGSYKKEDYENALKFSVACGSAAAFSEGLPSRKMIDHVYRSMN